MPKQRATRTNYTFGELSNIRELLLGMPLPSGKYLFSPRVFSS